MSRYVCKAAGVSQIRGCTRGDLEKRQAIHYSTLVYSRADKAEPSPPSTLFIPSLSFH